MNAPTSNGKLGVFFFPLATFDDMAPNLQSESLNALLRELALSLKKLTNDESSLSELDATLDIARELHERIAILRFRAIEEMGMKDQEKGIRVEEEEKREFERPFSFSIRTVEAKPKQEFPQPATTTQDSSPVPIAEPEVEETTLVAAESGMSLAERLQLAPLNHLTDAMGINDRVRFAQELFGGDMGAFKSACAAIESAPTEADGMAMLMSKADSEVDWTAEKGASADFAVLVSRLFVGKPA